MKILFSTLFVLLSFSAMSFEKDGIKFEDKIQVQNTDLVLNGVGIRKATIFKIKVYYAGVYLTAKTNDAQKIMSMNGPKTMMLQFVHDVEPAKKLHEAFEDAMENNYNDIAPFKPQMDKFKAILPAMKKGGKITFHFLNDSTLISINNGPEQKIEGAAFAKALFSVWFANPIDEELKKGLLAL